MLSVTISLVKVLIIFIYAICVYSPFTAYTAAKVGYVLVGDKAEDKASTCSNLPHMDASTPGECKCQVCCHSTLTSWSSPLGYFDWCLTSNLHQISVVTNLAHARHRRIQDGYIGTATWTGMAWTGACIDAQATCTGANLVAGAGFCQCEEGFSGAIVWDGAAWSGKW